MGIPRPSPPTLAEIEQQREDLLTQADLPSGNATSPADPEPTSPPITALPAPIRQQPAPAPRRSRQSVFDQYALYGLAGEAVRALAPHIEAQPEAILLQLLAAFGNILGPGPHCMVGATRHTLNLFVVLVGESSKARKGTSWNQIARLFAEVDQTWTENRVTSARLTARGLIGIMGQQAGDRRLLVLAEELASVLHTMGRSRSQLSPLLRCAWDSGTLRMLDRDRLVQASGGHLSLIGHITQRELAESLHRTEAHNGFANRCLWALRRAQPMPARWRQRRPARAIRHRGRPKACRRVVARPDRNPLSPRPSRRRTLERLLRQPEPGPFWPPRCRYRPWRSASAAPQCPLRCS
jgi:hypothetical protein